MSGPGEISSVLTPPAPASFLGLAGALELADDRQACVNGCWVPVLWRGCQRGEAPGWLVLPSP